MNNPINNILYSIFLGEYVLEGRTYIGFGILITFTTNNEVVTKVENVTTAKYELLSLVQLCNNLSLDPIHIYDVAEDFLS